MVKYRTPIRILLVMVVLASVLGLVVLSNTPHAAKAASFANFITRSGDKLYNGGTEYRFLGYNSGSMAFHCRGNDPYEQEDFFKTAQQAGATVIRTMPSILPKVGSDDCPWIINPRTRSYGEPAWQAVDQAMALSSKYGTRIMFPFVFGPGNNPWELSGWTEFWGLAHEQFYTDPDIKQSYKDYVSWILNRTNTVTGVQYKNDKAIFCWQLGNEMENEPYSWSAEMAAYIKSIDQNHLVCDGGPSAGGTFNSQALDNPDLDVIDRHYYYDNNVGGVTADRNATRGKKPLVVGEFGFLSYDKFVEFISRVIDEGTAGALLWQLDERSRLGGFIQFPDNTAYTYGYRWPGFPSGSFYSEAETMSYLRTRSYELQGITPPALPAPDAPTVLAPDNFNGIAWRGSVGATSYSMERAGSSGGPWVGIASGFDDAKDFGEAIFNDTTAVVGQNYYYRMYATNSHGTSPVSNVVGPVSQGRDGLVGHWKFDEGAHIYMADASGNGNPGQTPEGVYTLSWPTGVTGSAVGFDGSNTYINAKTNNMPGANNAQSFSWWMNIPDGASGTAISLTNNDAGSGIQASVTGGGQVSISRNDGTNLVSANMPGNNAWHHYAYTFDGTTHRLYVDGNENANSTVAPNNAVPNSLNFGRATNGSSYLRGQLDEVSLYNRELNASEVQTLANVVSTPSAGQFQSNLENGNPQPTWVDTVDTKSGGANIQNVSGICCNLPGVGTDIRNNEVAHSGNVALMYSGLDNSTTTSYAYTKVFDLSRNNLVVDANTTLSYWIFPQSHNHPDGGEHVSGSNSTCVAVDLIFSDTATLRDSGAVDQNGIRVHPAYQCNHLTMDAWNHVTTNLGAHSNGKTINHLDIGYDQPANTGGYRGYVDDIVIQN